MISKQKHINTIFAKVLVLLLAFIGLEAHAASCARIMPLGDSITYGLGSTDNSGYRQPLYNNLISNGYLVDFVGGEQTGPITFDNDHEGHGGWFSFQIEANVLNWLNNNPADFVLLHIGTNDIVNGIENPARIEAILNEIDNYSTDITVYLARIILAQNGTEGSTYNDAVIAMANNRIANGDKIVIVDQESALNYATDLSDYLHPNDSGYLKMANTWETALIPELTIYCSGPPIIASAAPTNGSTNMLYEYQLSVRGEQPMNYTLTSAPLGMSIDNTSGLITWDPDFAGSYTVEVTTTNVLGSDVQSYTLDILDGFIIDNGDAGTSSIGTWNPSMAPNPYGVSSLFSNSGSYSYITTLSGVQEVSLWWTQLANRGANIQVEIWDSTTLLDTVTVNQQINGGQWNVLGSYAFDGTAQVIIQANNNGTASADAVRFTEVAVTLSVITSVPQTSGTTGVMYNYDVQALSLDPETYTLLSAPAGMTIDPTTGLIQWLPSLAGDYPITVEVSNIHGNVQQSFIITISEPSADFIIDNGDPGTNTTGTWIPSSGPNPYGSNSLYSNSGSYSYTAALSGLQEVSLWWTQLSNRSTNVQVEIWDSTTLLDTLAVNQQANGGQWNILGSYLFDGTAQVIVRANNNGTVSADAVKFTEIVITTPLITSTAPTNATTGVTYNYDVDALTIDPMTFVLLSGPVDMVIDSFTGLIQWTPVLVGDYPVTVEVSNLQGNVSQNFIITVSEPSADFIIDNGDAGTSTTGTWSPSSGPNPYGSNSLYSNSGNYSYTTTLAGIQEISLWWTQLSNRSASVQVEIWDSTTLLDTITVNQQINGGQWNILGTYVFDGTAQVIIRATNNGTVSADAVKFTEIAVTVPIINSSAQASGITGVNYSYNVDALTLDPATYTLLSGPVDMSIDSATGLIQWLPSLAGDYPVIVEVSNIHGSAQQSFAITISEPVLDFIMDNDDTGTSTTGTWGPSIGPNPYGSNSLYSSSGSYRFETARAGAQQVSLWWTQLANRSTGVQVQIWDGATLLDTVIINQRVNGGQWNILGTYVFNGTAQIVILANNTGTVSADAARFLQQ